MNLRQLRMERELHEVLITYTRLCDERDWSLIDRVFAPAATADYGGHPLPNRDKILRMLQRHLGGCGPTQHLLGNFSVQHSTPPATRVAVRAAHRGAGPRAQLTYECLGHYEDRWCFTPEGWRIEHRRMVVDLEFGDRAVLQAGPA